MGCAVKVQSATADQLELVWRPWALSIGFAVLTLILAFITLVWLANADYSAATKTGFGLALSTAGFAAFLRQEIVIFNRPANAVVLRSASLFGTRETSCSLTGLIRAEARTNSFGATRLTTWRPVLIFQVTPTLPLTAVFIGGASARTCVDAINHWLTHPYA